MTTLPPLGVRIYVASLNASKQRGCGTRSLKKETARGNRKGKRCSTRSTQICCTWRPAKEKEETSEWVRVTKFCLSRGKQQALDYVKNKGGTHQEGETASICPPCRRR